MPHFREIGWHFCLRAGSPWMAVAREVAPVGGSHHGVNGSIKVLGESESLDNPQLQACPRIGDPPNYPKASESLVVRNTWFGDVWGIKLYKYPKYSLFNPHQHPMFTRLSGYDFHISSYAAAKAWCVHMFHMRRWKNLNQWPLQEAKLEVPTIYKAYVSAM